jgi:hypothetical protein
LDVGQTPITGSHFGQLPSSLIFLDCQDCKNLAEENLLLSIRSRHLSDGLLKHVEKYQKLQELFVGKAPITGTTIGKFPRSLKALSFEDCQELQDSSLSSLQSFLNLEELSINGTNLRGTNIDRLPSSIKKFSCKRCRNITKEAISKLTKGCPYLEQIHIYDSPLDEEKYLDLPAGVEIIRDEND